MKKILVTGGSGFVGGYVVHSLLREGYKVVTFDHHRVDKKHSFPSLSNPNVENYLGDVRNAIDVDEAMTHVDGWIHLAAILGTQETITNPKPATIGNIEGSLNVLEAAAREKLPGVYISVGNYWMNNPYSISKSTVERLAKMYNKERGTQINQIRGVNAYGPWQRAAKPFAPGKVRKIIPSFVCRALSGMPLEIYGDGNQISDMVWVGDLADTLVYALTSALEGNVYNEVVACGPIENRTVKQIAEMVINSTVSMGYPEVPIVNLPMRPGEEPNSVVSADIGLLRSIGIDPGTFTPLSSGIQKTVEWFESMSKISWSKP